VAAAGWKSDCNTHSRTKKRGVWMTKQLIWGFSQNQLKIIAAISMLVDHIGAELLPQLPLLRIIGRLAFPIFCFYIYEGSRYTHDRKGYLARILGLGLLCMLGYYIYDGQIYANVLITFSLSIILLYSLSFCTKCLLKDIKSAFFGVVFLAFCLFLVYAFCGLVEVDYGFFGVVLPLFPAALTEFFPQDKISQRGLYHLQLAAFTLGLLLLAYQLGGNQYYSLAAIAFLLAYNGQRGKLKLKYFFYIFYPLHLILIGLVAMLLEN
jgi:hypothetical protein